MPSCELRLIDTDEATNHGQRYSATRRNTSVSVAQAGVLKGKEREAGKLNIVHRILTYSQPHTCFCYLNAHPPGVTDRFMLDNLQFLDSCKFAALTECANCNTEDK